MRSLFRGILKSGGEGVRGVNDVHVEQSMLYSRSAALSSSWKALPPWISAG